MSLITSQPTSSNVSTVFDEFFQKNDKEAEEILRNAHSIYWGDVKTPENQPKSFFVAKEVIKLRKRNPYHIHQDLFLKDNILEYLNSQKPDRPHFNFEEIDIIIQACKKLKEYPQYDRLREKTLKLIEHLESKVNESLEYKFYKELPAKIKLLFLSQYDENSTIASQFPEEIVELIKKHCIDIFANAAQTPIDIRLSEGCHI